MSDEHKPGEEETEVSRLDDWGARWAAPPSLRSSTLDAARRRGLVGGRTMNGRRLVTAAAIALVMFGAGFGVGSKREPAGVEATKTPAPEEPRYALFLFEDTKYQAPAPDELRDRVDEYVGWARSVGETGRFVTGEKLADDGTYCRFENGVLATGGPLAETSRGMLAGYFVIGAASLDEALDVARGCPHLKYGGSVEIRRLETT
jgi:hypothetical protein